jgi:hypothetical protein
MVFLAPLFLRREVKKFPQRREAAKKNKRLFELGEQK